LRRYAMSEASRASVSEAVTPSVAPSARG